MLTHVKSNWKINITKSMKVKKNYIIPYTERFTTIGRFGNRQVLMCVDMIGLVVRHDNDSIPTEDDVRGHLIGNKDNSTLVQAHSLQEALEEFYNYPECKTGITKKAWDFIDSEKNPIIEYSGCKHMNFTEGLWCQRYAEEGEKLDHMFCVLDGLSDPPTDCSINNQIEENGVRKNTERIGGVWVRTFTKTLAPNKQIGVVKCTY